ncbi:MAG TPA: hypothetical protein PK573_00010 [Spirochaetota bacterium]|nr:hypothetical protein [Spirochaetota bacterium]
MNFKRTPLLIALILLTLPLFHCGENQGDDIRLDGIVNVEADYADINPTSPIFVAVTATMDRNAIDNDPLDSIVELAEVGPYPHDFSIDLSNKGLEVGDKVYLFAFIDNGYAGGIPSLDPGDVMGFYIDDDLNMTYTLNQGDRNFAEINITRLVYDFEASVAGNLTSPEDGNVILVAYAGEINSFDFNDIDINAVVGYEKSTVKAGTSAYSFDILPYGYDVPINNVYVFAFLDRNGNGHPDAGDMWGTASDEDGYPMTVTIDGDTVTNLDLVIDHDISQGVEGVTMTMDGSFTAPAEYAEGTDPAFIILCKAESPNAIFADTIDAVKYFKKLDPGQTTFNLDISESGLAPGDEVMIVAMWDRDYVYGFPRLTEGDMIGYYTDEETYSYQYTLKEGANSGITIDIEKEYEENNARIEGTILGPDSGKVITVAYTGELESFDLNLDMDKIIGYEETAKGAIDTAYGMDILPFTEFPVNDVYVFAFLDNNDNGEPDAGDRWGSYNDDDGFPRTITVTDGLITGIDISIENDISEPSGFDISLQGSFTAPAGYDAASAPVFMIVCQADDPEEIFNDTMSTVKYFQKLPAGQTTFDLDLSNTGLAPDDEVMIIALWDRDWVSGFPRLSEGDMIGYYIDEETYSYQYTLVNGINYGITIDLEKEYEENSAQIQGRILGTDSGKVITVAYTGEFESFNIDLDMDKIIGYREISKGTASMEYTMDILPFTELPVENVYVFAFLDNNGNGQPDGGDKWGSYSDSGGYPRTVTVIDGLLSGIDISLENEIAVSTGYEISLQGSFTAPAGYNAGSAPVFMIVCQAETTEEVFSNTMDTVKYFEKLPAGQTTFDLDLSGTDLIPGDAVMIIALWDLDYVSGFPSLSENDMIGYYMDQESYSYQYTLLDGENSDITIDLGKTYHDNSALISGTILGNDAGNVILVAYNGEFESFDLDLDMEKIIAYKEISTIGIPTDYVMEVLPFCELPLEDVYVFAFLDNNGNGKPDGGDRWGSYNDVDGYPQTIIVSDTVTSGINISIDNEISESTNYTISLEGGINAPAGYNSSSAPVFMIVCEADDPNAIFADTIDAVKYFKKLDPGQTTFDLDLSSSGLAPGDEVMIIALWDLDWEYGFPRLSEDDMIGYYTDQETYSYLYTLQDGVNSGITIDLEKEYHENNARVEGSVLGNDSGNVIIVAYTDSLDSFDFDLDMDKIIGYEKFSKGAAITAYGMDILPFTEFPVNDVYVFAFLDNNDNGEPDAGDRWGSYNDDDGFPRTITVTDGLITGIDISIENDISEPSGFDISLQGSFTAPAGYDAASAPVFMIVCQADDPEEIFNDTMSTVKYFQKLPAGQTTFDLDLSNTGLAPDDEVMIIALWDRDWVSGFPRLSEGDMIGYYIDPDYYTYQYALREGVNSGITLSLAHTYNDNSASVQGNILGTETGDVMIIAYTGEFNSLDAVLDTDKIIGYVKTAKGASTTAYTMDLMPFVSSFPISNVFIFAVLDVNGNGVPDNGDRIGFYSNTDDSIPTLVTLQDGANTGLDIEFLLNYVEPSSGGTAMTLSGSITAPSGYTTNPSTKPIFILVSVSDSALELVNNPIATMKYFLRLPQGSTSYNIDLSSTGLEPGDEVRILAIWDRDFTAGFPSATAGDKVGYYQNKTTRDYSTTLHAGANYANLTGGWSFGVNKTMYDHNAQLRFQFRQVTSEKDLNASLIQGKQVMVITIYQDGVDDDWANWITAPSYSITDMDYITSINYLSIPNSSSWINNWYTIDLYPFIYDNIPLTNGPLRMNNVYIIVILDSNYSGWPDEGEYLGYYWTWYLFNKIPETLGTMYYDRVNTFPNSEKLSIMGNRTYSED